jgi:hypothetical protein
MKDKQNVQTLTEKDQLKDIAWAKQQKRNKKVKRPKRSPKTQIRRQA